jgi:hypothetical protein
MCVRATEKNIFNYVCRRSSDVFVKMATAGVKADCVMQVARWFIFRPKIVIWVNFGGSCN